MEHFHFQPMIVNLFDLCQRDIAKGLLIFHPQSDFHKIP